MTHEPLIQLTDISAAYDRKQVLTDVNLTVYEKDFLGVIGPNGGGKTTLMKVILGLLKPVHGTIRFFRHGKEVPEVSIGYLPQYNHIDKKFPISVYEVVLSGLNKQKSLFSRFTAEQHRQVERTIARMGLEGLEQRAIGQLSGGQLQRALLGRAIVSCPQLIILDEPNTYMRHRAGQPRHRHRTPECKDHRLRKRYPGLSSGHRNPRRMAGRTFRLSH